MPGHLLGMLEPASVLQVNHHTRRAPGVAPDRRQKPRVPRSFADKLPRRYNDSARGRIARCLLFEALKQRLTIVDTDFG